MYIYRFIGYKLVEDFYLHTKQEAIYLNLTAYIWQTDLLATIAMMLLNVVRAENGRRPNSVACGYDRSDSYEVKIIYNIEKPCGNLDSLINCNMTQKKEKSKSISKELLNVLSSLKKSCKEARKNLETIQVTSIKFYDTYISFVTTNNNLY